MNNVKKSIVYGILCILMTLVLCSCNKNDETDSKADVSTDVAGMVIDSSPQYYMSCNSAASNMGFYYISGEAYSDNDLKYLYFFDFKNGNQYPVCSKVTCEHNDESCDAHSVLENTISNAIWYYKDRLYFVERTQEYDRVISYDLNGRDRQVHSTLNIGEFAPWFYDDNCCFSDGYIYYITNNIAKWALYRVGVDSHSVPELIKEYNNPDKNSMIRFGLKAVNDKVYINYSVQNYTNSDTKYYLDFYDTNENIIYDVWNTDSKENNIVGWHARSFVNNVLFDDKNNMYFAVCTDEEYIIKKLDISQKKVTDFYRISCNNTLGTNGQVAANDADYMELMNFDGQYLYVYRCVNGMARVSDFKSEAISVGIDGNHTITTEVNTNYLYVLDRNGVCINAIPIKIAGQQTPKITSRQSGMLKATEIFGNDSMLVIAYNARDSVNIEGAELSDLDKFYQLQKELASNHKEIFVSTKIMMFKSSIKTNYDSPILYNLANGIFTTGFTSKNNKAR